MRLTQVSNIGLLEEMLYAWTLQMKTNLKRRRRKMWYLFTCFEIIVQITDVWINEFSINVLLSTRIVYIYIYNLKEKIWENQ